MIEKYTPSIIFAEIKMVREYFDGTIIVTEGPSDCKFLRPLVSEDDVYLFPAHGKENAVGSISHTSFLSFDQ